MDYIQTINAPAAIGPYSQGVVANGVFYSSGQIPLTKDGELVSNDIVEQTHQVLHNLKSVLEAANSSLSRVIKTTVFIKDMNDFGKINEVYAQYFSDYKPARSCVEVSRLPKDVLIEIEVVALVN